MPTAQEDVEFEPQDPYMELIPVMAGNEPEGDASGWEIGDGAEVRRVESHRNLWALFLEDVCVVTFDADAFATTADLGVYIEGVIDQLTAEAYAAAGEPRPEDDARRVDGPESPSFQ